MLPMGDQTSRSASTAAVHTARTTAGRAVAAPIFQTTTFAIPSASDLANIAGEPRAAAFYTRHGNPNHAELADAVAELEGAEAGLVFASGMSVLATTLLTFLQSGDHIVAQRSMYGGSSSLIQRVLPRFGISHTAVDQTDPDAWQAAITPKTRLLLIESPSNPLLTITDLQAVADIASRHGILTLADNTFATPLNQRPLDHGIDLVWHSATKYLSGHSDVSAGVLVGSRQHVDDVWHTSLSVGAVLGPFDAWLATRGLRTLPLRVDRHNATAMTIAQHLKQHPAIEAVHYPGLPSHSLHDVAKRQMSGFGGVLSVEIAGGRDAATSTLENLELFQLSASLGSVESLSVHPASMWPAVLSPQELEAAGLRPGLIRLACGLEDPADLIADLDRALTKASPS